MDFIFSLAHFCEQHGPTSILCTQLVPPSCQTCTTSLGSYSGYSSDDSPPVSAPNTAPSSRANSIRGSSRSTLQYLNPPHSARSSLSPNLSPAATPPLSPKPSHTIPTSASSQSLLSHASTGLTDSCANCELSLPKDIYDRLPLKDGKKVPMLRSKEVVLAGGNVHDRKREQQEVERHVRHQGHSRRQSYYHPSRPTSADQEEAFISQSNFRRRSLSSASSSTSSSRTNLNEETDFQSNASEGSQDNDRYSVHVPPHTHNITYLTKRFPSAPDQFSALRRACVRTLSCEVLPGQTGPILVGDDVAGHTIAYVFRIVDPKMSYNRRTYALLCLCPDGKKIVSAYSYITSVFEQLVTRIKNLAAEVVRPVSPYTESGKDVCGATLIKHSITSQGFFRKPTRVEKGKDLAELVGREQLFVEVHACFSTLLGALARRFGCLDASAPTVRTAVYSNGIPPSVTSGGMTLSEREAQRLKGRREEFRRGVMT